MKWSDSLHLVAHYGYILDIGNTDGLTALMNIHEQVHNVIDLPWHIATCIIVIWSKLHGHIENFKVMLNIRKLSQDQKILTYILSVILTT